MFLDKVLKRNPQLVETVLKMHKNKLILPDTFIVDVDKFLDNAKSMLDEAKKANIDLYYMLKQVGRNPYLAKKLEEIGYKGAVVVDYKEARVMMKNKLKLAHVGHLVQVPKALIEEIVEYGCDYMTIYSFEKLEEINEAAKKFDKIQKICIRVIGEKDLIYSGQTAGFYLSELEVLVNKAKNLSNIKLVGLDSFPCFLYDSKTNKIKEQENLFTVLKAKKILEEMGLKIENVNAPSATCSETLRLMKKYPEITSAEPGHGFSGTTPFHAHNDTDETPCVIYLSEVSHNLKGRAYLYGGGYYRRGHLEKALICTDENTRSIDRIILPDMDSIDYHFSLENEYPVASPVLMVFRFQVFVTRSDVCLIEGLNTNEPKIVGLYDSLGGQI